MRTHIVTLMPMQAERRDAATFLADVAQESAPSPRPVESGVMLTGEDGDGPLQFRAIVRLAELGIDGEDALRALYAQGTVQEPRARAFLDGVARRGFRQPDRP
jgi:hypothetical protein